jgi:hypothetical protein
MTRKSEGATAGLRRGRTLATAGLGAATLIGGLVYAMPANAATNPTAKITTPATVVNDGTAASDPVAVTITNGTGAALTNVAYNIHLTIPGDANCAGASLLAVAPAPALTVSNCDYTATVATLPTGDTTASYTLAINFNTTGNVTEAFSLQQLDGSGRVSATLATASGTSTLVGKGPAVFSAVSPATIRQNYTAQLFTPPAGGTAPPSYTVYKSNTDANNVTCYSAVTANGDGTFSLNDGLVLFPATGKILSNPTGTPAAASPINPTGPTDSNPSSYIVVVNNGTGGATTANPTGTLCSSAAGTYASVPVALNDVSSTFSVPVLFKDVPLTAKFAKAIYALGDANISTGYADGSYQPTNPISRQAMASMLDARNASNPDSASDGGLTSCSSTDSSYSDLPYTSQFCAAIENTSADGLFTGYSDGTFQPAKNISRQAISAVLFREYSLDRLGSTAGDAACTTPVPFNDVSKNNQFCGDIEWMKDNAISTGYTDGGYHPAANASRQAVAQFLYQLNALENP